MRRPAFLEPLGRLVDYATAALLAVVAVIGLFQVIARYLLALPTPWSEELLRLLFVWLVLLGASRAEHMRMDLFSETSPPPVRRLLRLASLVVSASLLGLLILKGFDMVDLTQFDRYTALPLSVQWHYWSLIVCVGLWLLFTIAESLWPSGRPSRMP